MASVTNEVRALLTERLTTLDQVKIVLLLMQDSSRSWTAIEVASSLTMPPEAAAMRLFLLASAGLITFEASGVPRYRYLSASAGAETDAALRELKSVYEEDPSSVVAVLEPGGKDPIRSFSDAFKFKK